MATPKTLLAAFNLDCEACEILASSDGNEDKPKRFKVRAYNGGPLQVNNWSDPVVVDLAGMTAAKSVIANMHHDSTQIVGHVDEVNNSGKRLDLAGVLSGAGDAHKEFMATAANGFPWQASIEAKPTKIKEVPAGQVIECNGQTIHGPVTVALKSRLYGISFVPRGADENTSVKIAAEAATIPKEIDMEYCKWLESLGLVEASMSDAQKDKAQKDYATIKASAASEGKEIKAPAFDLDRLKAAYAKHEAAIEAAAFKYADQVRSDKLAEIKAGALSAAVDLKQQALEHEWAPQRFEVEALKAAHKCELDFLMASAPKGPDIHGSTPNLGRDVIEAAICQTRQINGTEKAYTDQTLQAAHDRFHGRIGLQQVFLLAAAQNGYHLSPGDKINVGNLGDVLAAALRPIHAGASVFSLSGIMSNVANKELLQGFMEMDQQWREISQVKSVNDFKTVTSYRMLDNMEYEEFREDGSMRSGQLSEESYTRKANTYGKMFSLTREDIINDDLAALDDLRNRLGRGAAKKFNKVFWTAFLSNSSFFTAARGNYITGSTTNLGTDLVGLALGVKAFKDLRSTAVAPAKQGERIGGTPTILLVPPEISPIAEQIYKDINSVVVSGVNIYANKYRPVEVAQLSDSNYTGYSATAWYLFRNPADLPAMVVSALNGVLTPTIQSAEAPIGRLGMDFHGFSDFGCDKAEWLCGIKSKGAA